MRGIKFLKCLRNLLTVHYPSEKVWREKSLLNRDLQNRRNHRDFKPITEGLGHSRQPKRRWTVDKRLIVDLTLSVQGVPPFVELLMIRVKWLEGKKESRTREYRNDKPLERLLKFCPQKKFFLPEKKIKKSRLMSRRCSMNCLCLPYRNHKIKSHNK